ncbi:hypothetical protein [Oleidesulfovibrio alaskensis]|jgi:hypothetical protein|uniref:hypothetical protein n=1 Tax=Oleidesulfovibrio alaskensis TaxID=58180 RepID=UPI001A5886DA|nr:hypothetical protein [Oleidesulfovibrio alaskensis]MBL3583212.1 hypothetical protein [Oleidesulfovibrio alaskensis]
MHTVSISTTGHLQPHQGGAAQDPLGWLGSVVRLEEGVTLRSVMQMLQRYPDLARISPFLQTALAEVRNAPQNGCRTPAFGLLQLTRTIELTGFPGNPAVQTFTTLRGTDGHGATEHELRFIPLDRLLDMPLTLGGVKHTVFGDRPDVLHCETAFSLFDVIEGIAWEIGFQGGSQQCSLRR